MTDRDETIAARFSTEISKQINSAATHIDIFYKGEELTFSKEELPIILGRDEDSCQIVVNTNVVSRHHCSIEVQDNQIGLSDNSTNGTFLEIGRSDSFVVKGKFYPLVGQGKIRLGAAITSDTNDIIYYRAVSK